MRLFAPGMSALHRAGLGGLACTLKALERHYANGLVKADVLPAPFTDGKPSWKIDSQTITLRFGQPENAGEYLKNLFAFAFQIRSGLIYLPGQHDIAVPGTAVLADLQAGFTLTFLQHGKVRKLDKAPTVASYDPDGDMPGVTVEYRQCSEFKHQGGWEAFVEKNGTLTTGALKVDGPISPGTVVRHVAFTGDTGAEDPPERMLPLYFALVGCLALPVNRGVAALLVPDVTDLTEFVYDRPAMTPTTATECQIAGAADAGFRAQVRLRNNPRRTADTKLKAYTIAPGCYAMTFTPTVWASQQKSRVATLHVPPGDDKLLGRYARALQHLPPRIVTREVEESSGKGKNKVTTTRRESFRTDSVVRPLIAENLARGHKWYAGFAKLMTKTNPATDKPYRDQLQYERRGLHDMIADNDMWDEQGESTVVRAVHEALRGRYAQIADENKGNPVAMRNRFAGEYDKWRLAFAGSKTADQFRKALCDLFSRAGRNTVLQQQWAQVLPMLRAGNWRHARDLALLALCSYQGRGTDTDDTTKTVN
ncbi:type I-MYXAN CRISPR-associated Cas8a1/Cmx1 [Gemmata sp. JC717]|uniref:type I-MYXAN CRISPR-associated Cas8a1/Cmx1 n=1 Tax=Gemmata algarum TaxID=2975278 RepID=UPI0021BAF8F6|nr:type I-MYXAN CRISPR-associated Cas8a1/Cmx1 [Gemmata algarum]MDY3556325.1 type I-MYXAN CRISPR-associated Cas8a1/Cmx1 [Gemmata algarum]